MLLLQAAFSRGSRRQVSFAHNLTVLLKKRLLRCKHHEFYCLKGRYREQLWHKHATAMIPAAAAAAAVCGFASLSSPMPLCNVQCNVVVAVS